MRGSDLGDGRASQQDDRGCRDGVFNFPIRQADHAHQDVLAARAIQTRWSTRRKTLIETLGLTEAELGVGVGLHCGELSFEEFGRSHRDLTAIGSVVNLASRAQSAAAAGEILVTEAIHQRVPAEMAGSEPRRFQLKGFDAPIALYPA